MAAQDEFANTSSLSGPTGKAAAVIKDDTNELGFVSRAIFVGTAGDLVVTMSAGNDITFKNVPAGALLPIRVKKVKAATTAADIVALY